MASAHWFPRPEDQAYRRDLAAELVRYLHTRTRFGLLGSLYFLFLFYRFLHETIAANPAMGHLILGIGLFAVFRIGFTLALDHNATWIPNPHHRHLLFIAQTLATGCGLGLFNLLALAYLDSTGLALLCVCQVAIVALAMVTIAASFFAYAAYMLPNMLALLLGLALRPHPQIPDIFPLILGSFIVASLYLASIVHGGLKRQTLLAFKLRDAALKDSLTGLYNRRFVMEFMETASGQVLRGWDPAGREAGPPRSLGLYMLDIDLFKGINDTHGHAAGDAMLSQLAMLLALASRKPDLIARWGGEEFLLIAHDVDREHPEILAERIRQEVESFRFLLPSGGVLQATCSIGCAAYPFSPRDPKGLSWEGALNLADAALYRAKQEGRNRSRVAEAGPDAKGRALYQLERAGKDITLGSGSRLLVIR